MSEQPYTAGDRVVIAEPNQQAGKFAKILSINDGEPDLISFNVLFEEQELGKGVYTADGLRPAPASGSAGFTRFAHLPRPELEHKAQHLGAMLFEKEHWFQQAEQKALANKGPEIASLEQKLDDLKKDLEATKLALKTAEAKQRGQNKAYNVARAVQDELTPTLEETEAELGELLAELRHRDMLDNNQSPKASEYPLGHVVIGETVYRLQASTSWSTMPYVIDDFAAFSEWIGPDWQTMFIVDRVKVNKEGNVSQKDVNAYLHTASKISPPRGVSLRPVVIKKPADSEVRFFVVPVEPGNSPDNSQELPKINVTLEKV